MQIIRLILAILLIGGISLLIVKAVMYIIQNRLERTNLALKKYDMILSFVGTLLTAVPIISAIFPLLMNVLIVPYKLEKTAKEKNKEIAKFYDGDKSKIPFKYYVKSNIEDKDLNVEFGIEKNQKFDNQSYNLIISGYPVGQYRIETVPHGREYLTNFIDLMVAFLKDHQSFDLNIKIKILGQADGIKSIYRKYDGSLGIISNEPYFSYDEDRFLNKNLYPQVSRLSNEDYAFLRAYDIKMNIIKNEFLRPSEVEIYTNTTKKIGDDHRKIVVEVRIKDAFKNDFEKFNKVEKIVFRGFQND